MKPKREPGVFLRHEPCPECTSRDNLARYVDGSAYCFSCEHWEPPTDSAPRKKMSNAEALFDESVPQETKSVSSALLEGTHQALTKRLITAAICKQYDYRIVTFKGRPCHAATYYQNGRPSAQKIRNPDKDFAWVGESKNTGLFGSQLWNGGKKIVVTEGEIDCLTVAQLQSGKWPVVSLPNGAHSAVRDIKKNIEYLSQFEEVILMFDMDEAGQEAAAEVAALLPPGKAFIASLPFKDPNECLVNGKGEEVVKAIWNAKPFRPDGLVEVSDLMDELEKPIEIGLPWWLPELTKATYGRRMGEIYGLGAGTGVGKTDFITQQIAYDVTTLGLKVGTIFLEQKPVETVKRLAGKLAGKRFHVPPVDNEWTQDELRDAAQQLVGKVTMYDSFGQTEWDVVAAKIRYMAVAQDIKVFYLDHLTALADTADEKGSLEQIMKELAGLANELMVIITFISHLTTPEGKPHEEGGRVTIRHFKGSRAIGFWSFYMFGMERNQQADDEDERQTTTFRVLKDRYTGQSTGKTFLLGYDADKGQLFPRPPDYEASSNEDHSQDF